MSKTFRSFLLIFATAVLILQLFNNSAAQDIKATIKIDSIQPHVMHVEGKRTRGSQRNLSFLTTIAGFEYSGERISEVRLFDQAGGPVGYKRFIPGEYVAEGDFSRWTYHANLAAPREHRLMAHVSWISGQTGILMLGDLLPQFSAKDNIRSADLTFDGSFHIAFGQHAWGIRGWEPLDKSRSYFVPNIENAALYVGGNWRSIYLDDNPTTALLLSGDTSFGIKTAAAMSDEIFGEYRKLFGADRSDITIGITAFPDIQSPGTWEADSRGSNITILYSEMPFKSQSLQRLHEQLRHEIFHLWIPNGVNLTGNYDWFYEGFALYQSLKLGVAVNRIRFEDFLDTLSRAYDIEAMQSQKLSLIEASKNRWNGSNTQVYARGMLVAFLCDLALLEKSKGKRSVANLLREIYEKHRPPNPAQDGNVAVLALLRTYAELVPIIDRNITKAESIDWAGLLKAAGLEAEFKDQVTKLKVTAKPSGSQKKLLDKLGYNSWRKLSERNR